MKYTTREYRSALCDLALDIKESAFIRRQAIGYLFKITQAEKGVTEYVEKSPANKAKSLPLAEKKQMIGLVYQAILEKMGINDSQSLRIFKQAIDHLGEDELDMEWEAIEDGTVSKIVDTMMNYDGQSDTVKQDIAGIFEGLARAYFVDYKGKVPKEDLKWAHKLVKDYFSELKKAEPLLGSGSEKLRLK